MSREDGFSGDMPSYYSNYADPAIFAKSRGRGVNTAPTWSVADEFLDRRIIDPKTAIAWRPANNNEAMTVNRLREYLRLDPNHAHPLTGKRKAPRIYFVRRTPEYPLGCHEVLTDIRAAKRVEVGTMPDGSKIFGDERDPRVRDHLLDTVRYAIGMRPALGPAAKPPPAEPGTIRIDEYNKLMDNENARAKIEFRKNFQGAADMGY
jgi:hypothetical protein